MTGNAFMSFSDHLSELRRRLLVAAVAVFAGTVVAYFFADSALTVLLLPSGGLHLRAFRLLDGLMIKLRLALYGGIILTTPLWAHQLIGFVSPGCGAPREVSSCRCSWLRWSCSRQGPVSATTSSGA